MEFKEIEHSAKSKSDLISENASLKEKINEFEKLLSEKVTSTKAYDKLQHDLLERVKKLNCICNTVKLMEETDVSLNKLFQKAVTFVPPAFQYPEISCARITFGNNHFTSDNFKETKWKLSTDIKITDHKVGCIDVFYLEEKLQLHEGPFHNDERKLLDTLGKQLGSLANKKITEDSLIENEKRLKSIFNAADNVSFILTDLEDKKTHIHEFSPGAEGTFGYKREEVIKKPVTILFEPKDVNKLTDILQSKRKEQKGVSEERILVRKNGEKFPALINIYPIYDANNKMIYNLIIAIDITELKEAQEKIKQSEETTKVLVNASLDSMILLDRKYKVVLINDIAAERLNLKVDTIIGKSIFNFLPMKSVKSRKAVGEEVFRTAKPKYFKDERNGYIFENSINPIFDKNGKVSMLAIYARDITEKERIERSIKASREQLRNLSSHLQTVREEERAAIARGIHDDLGQILTAAKMKVSELEKILPKRKKDEFKKTNSIKKLLDSASDAVHKISSDLRPSILDDLGLLAAIEWQAEEFHKNTGIKCDVKIKPREIEMDERLSITLYRIIQEALTNVTRHSRASKVEVSLIKQNEKLCLTIKDNGIGIKEEKINHPKSFGLMGIRERIVPWKGTMEISGVKNKGTTLTVNINLT